MIKNKKLRVSKRTSSYVHKTLAEYEQLVVLGYTHENFNNITRCLGKISGHLFLEENTKLEELWRDSYTGAVAPGDVETVVSEIRDRF